MEAGPVGYPGGAPGRHHPQEVVALFIVGLALLRQGRFAIRARVFSSPGERCRDWRGDAPRRTSWPRGRGHRAAKGEREEDHRGFRAQEPLCGRRVGEVGGDQFVGPLRSEQRGRLLELARGERF